MSNVRSLATCPYCYTGGMVVEHEGIFVNLECPRCKLRWRTLSQKCQKCKKPNGYATSGLCNDCYEEGHRCG